LYEAEVGKVETNWSKRKSIAILIVATALVAWMMTP
jgi:Ca2+/H+ antiporter